MKIKIAQIKEILENGLRILVVEDIVMIVSSSTLYNPSDHIYYNKFIGKIIPHEYLEGNFNKLNLIIDKLNESTLILPKGTDFKYFT